MFTELGKNRLEIFLHFKRLQPVPAMNALQARAVVSDNCVTPADVGEADIQRAIDYLLPRPGERWCERCGVRAGACVCGFDRHGPGRREITLAPSQGIRCRSV